MMDAQSSIITEKQRDIWYILKKRYINMVCLHRTTDYPEAPIAFPLLVNKTTTAIAPAPTVAHDSRLNQSAALDRGEHIGGGRRSVALVS